MSLRIGLTYDLESDYQPLPGDAPDEQGELNSEENIRELQDALEACGHRTLRIGGLPHLMRFLLEGRQAQIDMVFNYAVGQRGPTREAQVPALLEAWRVPYTGADSASLALCANKAQVKRLWLQAGLPTPPFALVSRVEELDDLDGRLPPFPLFVKPNREGTSKGITRRSQAGDAAALRAQAAAVLTHYRQEALVEAFVPGREFSVGVLGCGRTAYALGVVEAALPPYGFVDHIEKKTRYQRLQPFSAVEEESLRARLLELGLQAYRAVDCRAVGRIDLRLDAAGEPQLLEINPNPVLSRVGCMMSDAARFAGVSFEQLIAKIVNQAAERWALPA